MTTSPVTSSAAHDKAYAGFEPDLEAFLVRIPDAACRCGCEQPLTNAKRSFLQGHDARYKGLLIRAFRANEAVAIEEGGVRVFTNAETLAAERQWAHFLTKAPKRSVKASSKPSKSVRIRVGRWEHDAIEVAPGEFEYTRKDGTSIRTVKATVIG